MVTTSGDGSRRTKKRTEKKLYLASQLASICDVDLKTIHNWCDRNDDPDEPAELESLRTAGGHLRFTHDAVLRFLTRWGYPIPNELLHDRPHILLVEPDPAIRARIVAMLHLVRPGHDPLHGSPRPQDVANALGLWSTAHYYLHLVDEACTALVSFGERFASGAPLDLVVLPFPLSDMDVGDWVRVAQQRVGEDPPRVILISAVGAQPANVSGVSHVVRRSQIDELVWILDAEARQLQHRVDERNDATRKGRVRRRIPIAPKEPIFVASQVASIWNIDLKTVHNWVERGDMEAFRTPGRHLRFRQRSLLAFLRRYNMEIPPELFSSTPQVMLVGARDAPLTKLHTLLQGRFELSEQHDPIVALAEIGERSSGRGLIDAIMVSIPTRGVDFEAWLRAVRQHPDTRYSLVVTIGGDAAQKHRCQELGVTATVSSETVEQTLPVLEQALGLVRR
jgi:CheY-like chemotaxis protein/phage terminase Nu1 subunit (DNA packaging protein)